jgi:hypothetical protein
MKKVPWFVLPLLLFACTELLLYESSFRMSACFEKFDVSSRILDFMEPVYNVRGHNANRIFGIEYPSWILFLQRYFLCYVMEVYNFNHRFLHSPWSRVLLKKLTCSQLVKKSLAFYGTRRIITTFTRARQLSLWMVRSMIRVYGPELLALRPKPKLEDQPFSAVRDCWFNIFACAFHIGGLSSIRNLRTRHAVLTGSHLSWVESLWLNLNPGYIDFFCL